MDPRILIVLKHGKIKAVRAYRTGFYLLVDLDEGLTSEHEFRVVSTDLETVAKKIAGG